MGALFSYAGSGYHHRASYLRDKNISTLDQKQTLYKFILRYFNLKVGLRSAVLYSQKKKNKTKTNHEFSRYFNAFSKNQIL